MLPIKLWLNLTYGLGGDVVSTLPEKLPIEIMFTEHKLKYMYAFVYFSYGAKTNKSLFRLRCLPMRKRHTKRRNLGNLRYLCLFFSMNEPIVSSPGALLKVSLCHGLLSFVRRLSLHPMLAFHIFNIASLQRL